MGWEAGGYEKIFEVTSEWYGSLDEKNYKTKNEMMGQGRLHLDQSLGQNC